jgi:hypothetical protein
MAAATTAPEIDRCCPDVDTDDLPSSTRISDGMRQAGARRLTT